MTSLDTGGVRTELDRLAHWDGLIAELATAVIVTDCAGRVVIWNAAATSLFGWPANDALGRPVGELLLARALDVDAVAVLATVAAGRSWSGELECYRKDGSRVPVHVTLSAVYDDDHAVIGFVSESRDLSALKTAERLLEHTERLSSSLLMHTAEPAIVTDARGLLKYMVPSNESALGYSVEELTGTNVWDLVHPDDLVLLQAAYATAAADISARPTALYRARAKDGSWRWRQVRLSNFLDDPVLEGIVSNVTDVTDQVELVRELRTADARQRAIVARSRDATMFFDRDGTIRWASPITFELVGIPPEVLLGMNGLEFIHPEDQERVFAQFLTMAKLGDHVRTEFRITGPDGSCRWVEEDATDLLDDPDVGYIVANIRDITERRNAQEQLERLALYDQLTGLPNRSLVVNRLELLLERSSAAAVLHIDIDNFGDVNDSLGRTAGDELLRIVGGRFAAAVAGTESTLARVGGDEFVLLCDGVSDATTTLAYAERFRESLKSPVPLGGQDVFVSVSTGIALSAGDATALMRDADVARQQAKQQGRDRVVMFDARLDVTQQNRLTVHSELRHALAHDELEVWYQPIIEMRTGRVADVEALVRWNHPRRGLLLPGAFIDVAETSGLICPIGRQVLRRACRAARDWRELGYSFRISVNAAAAQLSSRDFVTEIERTLEEFGLDADQLTVELTETAAMQVTDSLDNLERIRALGVHLALDDFGTGYSSLSFLRELPIHTIKIDRAFVSGLGTNARDTSIVQGLVAMADALGHAVVAEGVETALQAEILRDLGCDYAQGFLWSPPFPSEKIVAIAHRIEYEAGSGDYRETSPASASSTRS